MLPGLRIARWAGMLRSGSLVFSALALGACHQQPTISQSNSAVEAQLSDISATTNATDGMDQGNSTLMGTPTVGQSLDASPQPPKR